MIPLRVLEELDQKKYGSSPRLRDVSRGVLSWIEDRFAQSASGPVPVGDADGTTVELLFPDTPRYKPSDADEEVLDVFDQVHTFVPSAILVTGDKAMRLRARARRCAVAEIPTKYLRVVPDADRPTSIAEDASR
jgi:predicted ribonuclease YlaK